jgi:hypothetical protein
MGDEAIRYELLAAMNARFDAIIEQARAFSARAKTNPNFMLDDLAAQLERDAAEIRARTAAASSKPAVARAKKQPPRTDYRTADAPLVEEIMRGIESGLYKSATDAARAVASRAAGKATDASKVRRLAGHARERQRHAQS